MLIVLSGPSRDGPRKTLIRITCAKIKPNLLPSLVAIALFGMAQACYAAIRTETIMTREPFYITTAISYPNASPHIGHAYEAIAADTMARFMRLGGRDVYFLTGADEHGLKMEQTARKEGMSPRALADSLTPLFQKMCACLAISNDDFIRTTEARHASACTALWNALAKKGDIYKGRYEGWYSVRDEAYYDEGELTLGEDRQKLSPEGTEVEWTVEESYFFRLSAYQQPLLDHYAKNPKFITPGTRYNEVVSFVKSGLKDLCLSRSSLSWGIPVPDDSDHVMYVWIDALTNYLTGIGYPDMQSDSYRKYWPAQIHVIGKDIIRFHAVFWPAFLLSAGLPLPERIAAHGFLFHKGAKMSKSQGNVVDPFDLAERYGVDALRYFLLREISFGQDGSYSDESITTRYNADLANSFGNLVQRVISFTVKNLEGVPPTLPDPMTDPDRDLLQMVAKKLEDMQRHFEDMTFSFGLESWLQAVVACNQYIDQQAPWVLRKSDPKRMEEVLAVLILSIRDLAIAIQPVMPGSSGKILNLLGCAEDRRSLGDLGDIEAYQAWYQSGYRLPASDPIFPKLQKPAKE